MEETMNGLKKSTSDAIPKTSTDELALNKVREILFGAQAEVYESRLSNLEVQVGEEVEKLNEAIAAQFQTTSRNLKDYDQKQVEKEKKFLDALYAKIDLLQANTSKEIERLQAQFDAEVERQTQQHQTIEQKLDKIFEAIQNLEVNKTDNNTLSGLFTQMATTLNVSKEAR